MGDGLIAGRAAQSLQRLLDLGVNLPGIGGVEVFLQLAHFFHELVGVVGGHFFGDLIEALLLGKNLAKALFHVAADCFLLIQRRLLQQNAHGGTRVEECLTVGGLVQTSHNFQDGGFTGTIRANNTNLCARKEGHGDIVQNDLVTVCFAHVFHRVDELTHDNPFYCCNF